MIEAKKKSKKQDGQIECEVYRRPDGDQIKKKKRKRKSMELSYNLQFTRMPLTNFTFSIDREGLRQQEGGISKKTGR